MGIRNFLYILSMLLYSILTMLSVLSKDYPFAVVYAIAFFAFSILFILNDDNVKKSAKKTQLK